VVALAPCAYGDDRRLAVVDEGHGGAPRIGDDIGDVDRVTSRVVLGVSPTPPGV